MEKNYIKETMKTIVQEFEYKTWMRYDVIAINKQTYKQTHKIHPAE